MAGRGLPPAPSSEEDKERRAPLPETFGALLGVSSQAVRPYQRGMLKKASLDKKISPHKLRHTCYAMNLLNARAELVDIQARLGHANLATTRIFMSTLERTATRHD